MKLKDKMHNAFFLALNRVFIDKLSDATPVDTSETASLWEVIKSSKKDEFIIRNTNGDVVLFLEEGTDPYPIEPKNKKMLRFELKKKPKFKKPKDLEMFNKNGKIFFFNKHGRAVLGFVKEGDKIFCFARKINHPGIKARHFVKEVLNNKNNWVEFDKEVKTIMK